MPEHSVPVRKTEKSRSGWVPQFKGQGGEWEGKGN